MRPLLKCVNTSGKKPPLTSLRGLLDTADFEPQTWALGKGTAPRSGRASRPAEKSARFFVGRGAF
jgi:hypothetical protein